MSAQPKCTCNAKYPSTSTKWHDTEVDDEGICIHCGHYAVWHSEYDLFPKSYFGIHGYKQVSNNPTPGWTVAEIDNYFSHIDSDHCGFEVFSGNENLDYSGVGTGSRRSRRKKEGAINYSFNRRKNL